MSLKGLFNLKGYFWSGISTQTEKWYKLCYHLNIVFSFAHGKSNYFIVLHIVFTEDFQGKFCACDVILVNLIALL